MYLGCELKIETMLKKTPLFEIHRSIDARMVDFSGFEMPIKYKSIKEEHIAVRKKAGMFDVSHMGEVLIRGERALEVVQELTVNDASQLKPGKAQYSVMCREHGGIIDDLLVYCLSDVEYMMVINGANIEKDFNWILEVNDGRTEVSNISDEIGLIALQGPESSKILNSLTSDRPDTIPVFEFRSMQISDYENILVSATGYTGESGFELYFNIRHVNACDLWQNIMTAGDAYGLKPCGLGARDTLRLEAGLPLYGNDLTEEMTPLEARLGWLVKWDKSDFVGKEALLEQKKNGINHKLYGMIMKESKRIPRNGSVIVDDSGQQVGKVTSGGLSIMLDKGIAMGYVSASCAEPGKELNIEIRNQHHACETVKPPFYSSGK